MDLTIIRVKTYGLYADGVGMPAAKYDAWRDYWSRYFGHHWKACVSSQAIYLVGVDGGGMIHPEGFRLPVLAPVSRFGTTLAELDACFKTLSKQLGFAYRISTTYAADVDLDAPVEFSTEVEAPTERKEQT